MQNFARVTAPLTELLKTTQGFAPLSPGKIGACEALKKLITAPVLALPHKSYPCTVDTDASENKLCAVQMQTQPDGNLKSIGYFCRRYSSAKKNYLTTHHDFLAVVRGITLLLRYLECTIFTVRNDHHSLRWILPMNKLNQKLAWWLLQLQEFDFDVTYRTVIVNKAA